MYQVSLQTALEFLRFCDKPVNQWVGFWILYNRYTRGASLYLEAWYQNPELPPRLYQVGRRSLSLTCPCWPRLWHRTFTMSTLRENCMTYRQYTHCLSTVGFEEGICRGSLTRNSENLELEQILVNRDDTAELVPSLTRCLRPSKPCRESHNSRLFPFFLKSWLPRLRDWKVSTFQVV